MRLVGQVIKALAHRPWYAASIVTVIAISCALLTSVLAVVDGVLFRPLGYPDERHIVAVKVSSSHSRSPIPVGPDDLAAWARAAPGVSFTGFRVQPVDEVTSVARAVVQASFFNVIGVTPALGGFAAEDFGSGRARIEPRIVTDELFRAQFGGDPAVIGRVVILDQSTGYGYRIVGVMPRGFVFPASRWSVGYLTTYAADGNAWFDQVVARLPPDTTADGLRQRVLAAAAAESYTRGSNTSSTNLPIDQVDVQPVGRALGSVSRRLFATFLAGAALLVCIAALNASSLMAARAVDRRPELAVRRALGATPQHVRRLLLLEAALLVGVGTMIGIMVSATFLRFILQLLPRDLALFKLATVDSRVALFIVMVAVLIATLISVWPLRLAGAADTTPESTRNVTGRPLLTGQLVVIGQVAVAVVLTIGGSLLVGSLLSVYIQKPPITTTNILTISVRFLGKDASASRLSYERAARANVLLDRLRDVPGVERVAISAYDLLDRAYVRSWFRVPLSALNPRQAVMMQAVSADYYHIIQPQLVAGRWPTDFELTRGDPVIVVSQSLASNYWPNGSAIGQGLTDQGPNAEPLKTYTVVGVVKDIRWYSWDEAPLPMIYGPYPSLARSGSAVLLIRTSADVSLRAHILHIIGETDSLVRTQRVAPLGELFVNSVRPRRFQAWLFGSFAAVSLLIVGIGIFGQLATSTARRTREVGIRMTFGATRLRIARQIVAEQIKPVVAGLVVGGIGAAWAVRFVSSYLYQLTSFDPRVWAAAIALILVTAVAGTLIPALRASRINPNQALKAD